MRLIRCCALTLLLFLPARVLLAAGNTPPPPGQPESKSPGLADTFEPVFFDDDLLTIEVFDAYYDGRTLSMEWQVRNVSQEPLYLLLNKLTVNDIALESSSEYNPDQAWLIPGASPFGDIEAELTTPDTSDTGWVSLGYQLYRPITSDTEFPYTMDLSEAAAGEDVRGELTLLMGGMIALPEGKQLDPSLSYAEALVEAGALMRVAGIEAGVLLDRFPLPRTALPDGQPLEYSLPGYDIRVTRADFTTYAGHIDFDLVFANREAMEQFVDYYPTDTFSEKYWDYRFTDENGSQDWHDLSSFKNQERPQEQPDGTWVWHKFYTFSDIKRLPNEIKVLPFREQGADAGVMNLQPIPEESFLLVF